MARLTIVVEVPDGSPTTEDPEDVADGLLVDPDHYASRTHELLSARWGDDTDDEVLCIR